MERMTDTQATEAALIPSAFEAGPFPYYPI